MTEEQRDTVLAHVPPPAVDMWTGMGEKAFETLIAEIREPLA